MFIVRRSGHDWEFCEELDQYGDVESVYACVNCGTEVNVKAQGAALRAGRIYWRADDCNLRIAKRIHES